MAEQLNLATPQVRPEEITSAYKVASLTLQVEQQRVTVTIRGTHQELIVESVSGSEALTLMQQLNTANLTNRSLQKRILEWVASRHPELTGTVSGTPD